MGIEWIFIATVIAVFAFCMFRWITFGLRFGGNKFAHFLRGLALFVIAILAIVGVHVLAMLNLPYISRFYYDDSLQLANVIFVSGTTAVFVVGISEFVRTKFKRKRLHRFDEVETIGDNNP